MATVICHNFKDSVATEIKRSREKHTVNIYSRHEALAVIQEEFEEVKEAVFRDMPREHLHQELIQLAAMCQRTAEDLGL